MSLNKDLATVECPAYADAFELYKIVSTKYMVVLVYIR